MIKVCFAGLGSIGKKHLKNLEYVSQELNLDVKVDALRHTENNLPIEIKKYIDREIYDPNKLDYYDIVFITNPTYLHYKTMRLFLNTSKNMFIEKPIFDDIDYKIDRNMLNKNGVYYVAAPLRYKKVISYLKKNLQKTKIYSVRAICSSYLPDWRPNTDYKKSYSAKKEEGGGVSIDLIHEWDYLIYLFGFPQEVYNLQGKFSHLDINSEDLSVYIGQYKDKLIELHLDYFGRVPKREIEIYTERATIIGDLIKNKVSFSDDRNDIEFFDDSNQMYLEEMRNFFDMILNKRENKNDLFHAYKVLKFIKGLN
jgi:predicted dehydrogenase